MASCLPRDRNAKPSIVLSEPTTPDYVEFAIAYPIFSLPANKQYAQDEMTKRTKSMFTAFSNVLVKREMLIYFSIEVGITGKYGTRYDPIRPYVYPFEERWRDFRNSGHHLKWETLTQCAVSH